MIKQLRIDERLIHGQITTNWSRSLGIDAIIVANDATAKNDVLRKTLLMAAPAGKKVLIKSVDDVIKLLDDPRADTLDMLLIADNIADAIKLVQRLPIKTVNIANFNKKKGENKIRLTENLSLTPEDQELLKELCSICDDVHAQMLPTTKKIALKNLAK